MRRNSVILGAGVAALLLTVPMGAWAEEAPAATEQSTEAGGGQGKTLDQLKWSDFAFSLDGHVIDLPVAYADLEPVLKEMGFEAKEEDLATELQPNQYTYFYFKDGKNKILLDLCNLDVNSHPASECIVGGFETDVYYLPLDAVKVELPGGIVRGVSTMDDIKAAYGLESDVYEGDQYTELTYETDIYERIKLQVAKDTGLLTEIDIEDLEAPEGFEQGEVSDEVPAAVTAYQKPDALSEDPREYQIRLQDQVYALPVPVSTLIADGYVLDETDSDMTVSGGSSGYASLLLGGQKLRAFAKNFEKNATRIENCWVISISAGKQDLDVEAELPGGITVGMSSADLDKRFQEMGITPEKNESGDFIHYNYLDQDYGQGYQVTVYTGDTDTYPKDAVLTITAENNQKP